MARKDWDKLGFLTGVVDQEDCQASWAIVSTKLVSTMLHLLERQAEPDHLSVQELIDGVYTVYPIPTEIQMPQDFVDSHGCQLALYQHIFSYFVQYGVHYAADYPYIGEKGEYRTKPGVPKVKILDFVHLNHLTDAELARHLDSHPMASSLIMTEEFESYRSGIFQGVGYYEPVPVNFERKYHAILVVSSDIDELTGDYIFRIQNSWGTGWGEGGFGFVRGAVLGPCFYPVFPHRVLSDPELEMDDDDDDDDDAADADC